MPECFLEKLSVERLKLEDIPQIMALQEIAKLGFWSSQSYRQILSENEYLCLTAKIDGRLTGFLNSRLIKSEDAAEILNVAVSSEFQNRGIAQKLFDSLLNSFKFNEIRVIFLEVRETNLPARQFYKKNGFRVTGRRKEFYKNPSEDALLMRLNF